jgi:putative pyruvate formate lyase activating enzyme
MISYYTLLPRYYRVLENEDRAKFLNIKDVKVDFQKDESLERLWIKHKSEINQLNLSEIKPEKSLLDLKIQIARKIFQNCSFCERKCNTNRTKEQGRCNVKESKISSEFLHIGEESVLVPSHTIFFSGCTLNCVFCQNWDISQSNKGLIVEPKILAGIIKTRKKQGSKNVNWVGGDPTPNILFILQTLKNLDENINQIWNSNMYYSKKTMKLLENVIDLYLTDFKYGNDKCAERLSKVKNYFDVVKRNHKFAYDTSELIIRHLILPNHIECCSKPILDWISKNTPNAVINIMNQYRPEYKSRKYLDINRHITLSEFQEVKDYAEELNLYLI